MDDDCFEGYIYADIDNPMVAWNLARGTFCTPDCLPEEDGHSALSFAMARMLENSSPKRLTAEIKLEQVRSRFYPGQVSRLKGLFAFDDIDSVAGTWVDRQWGGHFSSDNLTDIGVAFRKSSRHDSNWLNLVMDADCNLLDGWEDSAHQYWQGAPCSGPQPIWERIFLGCATVWGTEIKRRAIDEVRKYWPNSITLLEISANCVLLGSHDGIIVPFITGSEGMANIEFCLRMVDCARPDFVNSLESLTKSSNPRVARFLGPPTLETPDFRCYNFSRPIQNGMLSFESIIRQA